MGDRRAKDALLAAFASIAYALGNGSRARRAGLPVAIGA
jgi:hypothetical protein